MLPTPPTARWQPLSARGRLLLLLAAVAVTAGLLWQAAKPKLALMAAREARGEAPVAIGLPTEAHQAAAARVAASAAAAAALRGQAASGATASGVAASASASASAAGSPSRSPDCGPGQPTPCVGGRMPVLLLPAVRP